MTSTTMTSRERVCRMFSRQDQDRVPRYEHFWTDTIERWQTEGFVGNEETLWAWIGSDFQSIQWSWPAPFPGRSEVVEEDTQTRVVIDQFGQKCRFWKKRMGTPEHLGWECLSRDDWENTFKPAMLQNTVQIDLELVKQTAQTDRWRYLTGVEGFEASRKLLGDEGSLIAMAADPDWIKDLSKVHTDLTIQSFQTILDHGIKPEGLWIYGDMAYTNGTVCSPTMYRDLIWPDHQRLADFAHHNNMKIIFHTDGDINRVIPMYIEAGFDMLQPLEAKANMDIRNLSPDYGDKIGFFGNIDTMIMATGDRDQIEHEMRTKIQAGKDCKAYAYHSDHSVPPTVSWKTYQYVIELLDKFGYY